MKNSKENIKTEFLEWTYIKEGDEILLSKNKDSATFKVVSFSETIATLKNVSTSRMLHVWKYDYPKVYKKI